MKRLAICISILAIMLALGVSVTTAQEDCPAGLDEAQCAVLNGAAAATIENVTSFNLTFDTNNLVDLGELILLRVYASGSGPIIMEDGEIVAASLMMPEAGLELGGMMGGFMGEDAMGSAAFVLVDGVMYFGAGEDMESLEWRSITLADYPEITAELTFAGFAGSAGTALPNSEWSVNAADGQTTFSTESSIDLSDPELLESVLEADTSGLLAGLGAEGLAGTANIGASITTDDATGALAGVNSSTNVTFDLGAIAAELGEEGEMFSDMLSGEGGVTIEIGSIFSEVNADFTIEAPAEAEEIGMFEAETVLFSASEGLPGLLTAYFNGIAVGADDGGAVGGGPYAANCTPDTRTFIEGGAIALDETVTGTLAEGEAATWNFSGAAGDVVTIAMNSDPLDTFLELLGPDGIGLTGNDDFNGLNSQIDAYTLPADGTYTIVACTFSSFESGDYDLTLTGAE